MTETTQVDILISGGGIAGLTAAAAFGTAGFSVQCVDPTPPVTERDAAGADMRTTAFLQPARALLEEAGLWQRLDAHAAPLQNGSFGATNSLYEPYHNHNAPAPTTFVK